MKDLLSKKPAIIHSSLDLDVVTLNAYIPHQATKEEERAALAKIRKIVHDLGKDSYVGTAFDGCFEIAESNIDNDFADSLSGRVSVMDHETDALREEVKALKAEIKEKNDQIESLNVCIKAYEDEIAEKDALIDDLNHDFDVEHDRADRAESELRRCVTESKVVSRTSESDAQTWKNTLTDCIVARNARHASRARHCARLNRYAVRFPAYVR